MNKSKNLKRLISALLCTAVVITSLPWMEARAETAYTDITSRENVEVALRMGVIADSQYTYGAGTEKLDAALQTFNVIDSNYDGLAMVGDIVYQSSSTEVKTDVYDLLDTSLNTYVKNGEEAKPYIFAMGNHEFPLNISYSSNPTLVQSAKETYKEKYCADSYYDSTTNEGPYINQVFGATETNTGYHFITAAPIDYSNQLSTTSETWILEQVDAAIQEDANKPVFLLLHQPIQNTAYGSSTQRYSDNFKAELQKRPQVVVLAGHTHWATNDPRMIWQDGFSLVMIGCTGGGMSARYTSYSAGNEATLLEVDDNNVVSFHRIDVNSKKYIGEPWVLDIPAMVKDANDKNLDTTQYDTTTWKYTDARKETSATPAFPETAKISVTALDTSSFTVEFPQLSNYETDNDVIVGYRIQVINQKTQQQVQNYNVTSDYYTADKVETLSETVSYLASGTKYTVNVYAVSAFGQESAPLTRTIRTKDATATTTTVPTVDNREKITQNVGQATSYTCERTWGDTSWGFYVDGEYATYTFTVPTSGKYELIAYGGSEGAGSFSVQVDGVRYDSTVQIPGDGNTKNKISGGFYYLAAGEHTVRLDLADCTKTITLRSVTLAKEDDAVMLEVQAKEKTAVSAATGGYSDYTTDSSAGYVAFWNTQTVTFNPTIPKSGTYKIYVDGGAVQTGNTYSVTINSKTLSCDMKQTGAIGTFARNELLGTVDLDEGTYTLKVKLNRTSGNVSLRRVIFVQEGTMDYEIEVEALKEYTETEPPTVTTGTGNFYGSGWGCSFWNNYISFQVTPEHSGVYDLSWNYASAGCTGNTYINDSLVDTREYKGGEPSSQVRALQSIGNVILEAGTTYTIKIADDGTGDALNIERLVLTYLHKTTMEDGITIDAFVGDNVGTNATEYADGRGTYGYGFDDGKYMEFDVEVAQAGLYDVALQLGTSTTTSVSVYADGNFLATREEDVDGDIDTKNLVNYGQVVLQEGTHRFKVVCNSGSMQLFKLQLKSVRGLIDTDPFNLYIDANDYVQDGHTVSSSFSETTAGVVLGGSGDYVDYALDVPAGNYALSIDYGTSRSNAQLQLFVNGESIGNISLPTDGGYLTNYVTKSLGVIQLQEGENTIRIRRGSNWFTYGDIKLTKIQTPVSELYNGDYIITGAAQGEEISGNTTGDLIFRTYLPSNMKGQYVQVIAGLYDGDTLVESVWAEPVTATIDSVVLVRMEDVQLDSAKTYTWKVLDYVRYTSQDAGITDGNGDASGTLKDGSDAEITGLGFDKTIFGMKLIFEDTAATFNYASGVQVTLKDNGYLGVTVNGSEVNVEPTQFGFDTFKNQVFELQITTDATADSANIGIWINKELANESTIASPADVLTGNITFSNQGLERYSLWNIAKPDTDSADYIQLSVPYIVEYDTLTDVNSITYSLKEEVAVSGTYTATTCGVTNSAILWKKYDLHADGDCDVRDLVAMKKVESETSTLPESEAGYMAASYLDSAYEIVFMRDKLVGIEE